MSTISKSLRELSKETHGRLLASGLLFEIYPEASGDYAMDCKPVTLDELYEMINKAKDHDEAGRLYVAHMDKALELMGFNKEQRRLIGAEAYERGHSAGLSEILCVSLSVADFARNLLNAQGKE